MVAVPSRVARRDTIKSAQLSSDAVVADKWWERANCKGHDTDMWFPSDDGPNGYAYARRVCRRCPVQLECLTDALDRNSTHGMFGGLTPRERSQITNRSLIPRPRKEP